MPPDRPEVLLRKAKQDELAVEKLLDDGDIEDDLLGFHAQQAAEKMLKALLAARGVDYPKTHTLRILVELPATPCGKTPQAAALRLPVFGGWHLSGLTGMHGGRGAAVGDDGAGSWTYGKIPPTSPWSSTDVGFSAPVLPKRRGTA